MLGLYFIEGLTFPYTTAPVFPDFSYSEIKVRWSELFVQEQGS